MRRFRIIFSFGFWLSRNWEKPQKPRFGSSISRSASAKHLVLAQQKATKTTFWLQHISFCLSKTPCFGPTKSHKNHVLAPAYLVLPQQNTLFWPNKKPQKPRFGSSISRSASAKHLVLAQQKATKTTFWLQHISFCLSKTPCFGPTKSHKNHRFGSSISRSASAKHLVLAQQKATKTTFWLQHISFCLSKTPCFGPTKSHKNHVLAPAYLVLPQPNTLFWPNKKPQKPRFGSSISRSASAKHLVLAQQKATKTTFWLQHISFCLSKTPCFGPTKSHKNHVLAPAYLVLPQQNTLFWPNKKPQKARFGSNISRSASAKHLVLAQQKATKTTFWLQHISFCLSQTPCFGPTKSHKNHVLAPAYLVLPQQNTLFWPNKKPQKPRFGSSISRSASAKHLVLAQQKATKTIVVAAAYLVLPQQNTLFWPNKKPQKPSFLLQHISFCLSKTPCFGPTKSHKNHVLAPAYLVLPQQNTLFWPNKKPQKPRFGSSISRSASAKHIVLAQQKATKTTFWLQHISFCLSKTHCFGPTKSHKNHVLAPAYLVLPQQNTWFWPNKKPQKPRFGSSISRSASAKHLVLAQQKATKTTFWLQHISFCLSKTPCFGPTKKPQKP